MRALEADFASEYHRDLRDLWVKGSGITVRWVIDHFEQLAPTSRVKKHLIGDRAEWGYEEHLLADVRDLGVKILYFTTVLASTQRGMTQSTWSSIVQNAPSPIRRPGDDQESVTVNFLPEEDNFLSKDEISELMQAKAIRRRQKKNQQKTEVRDARPRPKR